MASSISARRIPLDAKAKPERVQERLQAAKFRVPALGEHTVEALPVELGGLRQRRESALWGASHVAERQQEDLGILSPERGVPG